MRGVGGVFGITIAVVLSLWLAYHAVYNARHAQTLVTEGRGYHSKRWIESETVRYLEAESRDGQILSRNSHLLYWHLKGKHWERSSVDALPDLHLLSLPRERQRLRPWVEEVSAAASETHIVWFKVPAVSPSYNDETHEITALPDLEPVTELSDGVIWRVRK